ncbi:MAG: hypothetical protein VX498_03805, partial [Myxococcota bacterium]|nr:hypothetical protein [Myxococcota bacterium]
VGSVVFAVLAVLIASRINSIEQAWKFVAALGSGLGLPVLLRWVWWRTNAQAEIWGAIGSLGVTCALSLGLPYWTHPFFGPVQIPWEYSLLLAVATAGVASLAAIVLYGPSDEAVLTRFYERVRPPGWWGPIRQRAGMPADDGWTPRRMALAWLLGSVALIAAIFAPGHLLLGQPELGLCEAGLALIAGTLALRLGRMAPREEVVR